MSKELERTDYGETLAGYVTVIKFAGTLNDSGVPQEVCYNVRHGVHTIGAFDDEAAAKAVAAALLTSNGARPFQVESEDPAKLRSRKREAS